MNKPTHSQLIHNILEAYLELGNATRLASLPNWITAELNLSQLKAIILLEHYGPLTVSELARRLDVGNPAASVLVQQLVEQGLVERSEDPKDRRRTFVSPTGRGIGLIAGRREQIRTNLSRWLSQLHDEDLVSLHRGLGALRRVLHAEKNTC